MKPTLYSILTAQLRLFTHFDVVWQGKVKPVRYRIAQVAEDGFVTVPADDPDDVPALHPYSAVHSITPVFVPEDADGKVSKD